MAKEMDETYEKIVKEKKNTVDDLINLLKDSKLVESTRASEEKARQLFADVANKSNVECKKFREVLETLAKERQQSVEDFYIKVTNEGSKIVYATIAAGQAGVKAALSKFQDEMNK